MSFLERVDVLILSFNEEANIARTLDALRAFPRVLVLDSGSTDRTLEIARGHPNVRVCTRPFDSHSAQWNHGLRACGLAADWVLALDADYVLCDALVAEIAQLDPPTGVEGYRARFQYCVEGRPLSGSLYPPVTVLYRRAGANYVQDGHTQRVVVQGAVGELRACIRHDDRKPLAAWFAAQARYAQLECAALAAHPPGALSWRDRVRRMIFIAPWLVPLHYLVFKGGLRDGRHGLFYALQRGIAEAVLSLYLLQRRILRRRS